MRFVFKDIDGAVTTVNNPSARQIQFAEYRTMLRYNGKVYVFQMDVVGTIHFSQCQEPQFFRDDEALTIAEQVDNLIDEAAGAGFQGDGPDKNLRDALLARLGALP